MHHFAVLGNPIAHSLSPKIHQAFAQQFALDITYEKILTPPKQLKETIRIFRKTGGDGANITHPFKEEAFAYADQLTDRATAAGAVNTLLFQNNTCIGDNTDGIGLLRDLEKKGILLNNKRILILGAGGAAKGIIPSLLTLAPKSLSILNRSIEKSRGLAERFGCALFSSIKEPADFIINATSANFQEVVIFDQVHLKKTSIYYDLNYAKRHESFKAWAKKYNAAHCYHGAGMLVEQAAESFYLWTGKRPSTADIIEKLNNDEA